MFSLGRCSFALALGTALAVSGCTSDTSLPGEDAALGGGPASTARAPGDPASGGLPIDAPGDRVSADDLEPDASTVGGKDGGTDAADARLPCVRDDDCRLVNDCCSCLAVAKGESAPACDAKIACVLATCPVNTGIDRVRCAGGRCVLGFECDTKSVACRRLAPVCPKGQVPRIVDKCYGPCVDARQCRYVTGCDSCARGDTCVPGSKEPGAPFHCVP
jgi:hypothetical protein